MLTITEQGHIITGGNVEVGSRASVGFLDEHDIVSSAQSKLAELELTPDDAVLLFSCINRYLALGYDYLDEVKAIHRCLSPQGTKCLVAYSGGELCPVPNKAKGVTLTNRFHNNTLVGLII